MSFTGHIDIYLHQDLQNDEAVELINCYLNNGWTINDNGKITYFIGKDYDFQSAELENKAPIINLLKGAIHNKTVCGITMFDAAENTGGELIFHDTTHLSFSISINKKYTDDTVFDYDFYIKRLAPCLTDKISSISCHFE